jgi:hypothetical protein
MNPLHSFAHAPPFEPSPRDLGRVAVSAHTKKFPIANSRQCWSPQSEPAHACGFEKKTRVIGPRCSPSRFRAAGAGLLPATDMALSTLTRHSSLTPGGGEIIPPAPRVSDRSPRIRSALSPERSTAHDPTLRFALLRTGLLKADKAVTRRSNTNAQIHYWPTPFRLVSVRSTRASTAPACRRSVSPMSAPKASAHAH